ncbi:hypothetical protein DFH07DRAFT_980434 [Mycena maculata]|uniref:Uncharacterized protein n=1 Tax=Mycena maculata TaxID=230809 RepID=A0AAD7N234_9AGAR|nr:hypothetical protein DFH07DRAFT_980434 [Mycena maculata]
MPFLPNALLSVALAGFTPQAAAYIAVVGGRHSVLSNTGRIVVIVMCIAILLFLLTCSLERRRQNRRVAAAAAIPVMTTQVPPNAPVANYASGYNGYPMPPPPQAQVQYPPPQGYPQNYGQPAQNLTPGQPYNPPYSSPTYGPGAGGEYKMPSVGNINSHLQQQYSGYAPAPGPPPRGVMPVYDYNLPPRNGYDAAIVSPVPQAHTTVCSIPS